MPTILIKKSDTPGSVPGTANLTNLAGGAEVAVNTADRRMYSMNSSSAVVELGTNPSSLTCADGSFTLLKAASASITNLTATSLVLSNLSIASANITTLTSASATITNLLGTTLTISGNSFLATSSGNVGIGTSSPAFKLHVSGSSSQFALVSTTDTTSTTGVLFGDSASNTVGRVEYVHSDNGMRFYTNGSSQATLDSSGNLGLGVTPSAWGTVGAFQLKASAALFGFGNSTYLTQNHVYDGSTSKYITTGYSQLYEQNRSLGVHAWYTAPSGTAGNAITFTQAMTLTAAGNLLVGTTSELGTNSVNVNSTGTTVNGFYSLVSGFAASFVGVNNTASTVRGVTANTVGLGTADAVAITFGTNNAERARITSAGYFRASNDGTYFNSTGAYHELRNSAADNVATISNSSATNPNGMAVVFTAASPNDATNHFIYCQDNAGGGTQRATIRSNGGLANYQANDANLSDQRVKKDVKPLGSMWDKFKAIEIVTFKYKDQTHDDDNIGVIAQQVESVAPEFIDADGWGETPEDGVPLKTVYTTDMYHAAIKALQEAMARIEQLEAKVAALETK